MMDLWLYFLTLVLVLNFHRFVGSCVNKIGIPRIIGDIIAGCLLGPTIMGPSANVAMFPYDNRQLVNMSGQFGLIMTSMNAGFNFDRRVLSGRKMIFKVVMYTFLNMAIPTLIAVPLAYILPNTSRWRGPDDTFHFGSYFTLIACAMSSSALPMVFLILDELKLKHRFAIGFSCLSTIALFTMLSVASALADPNLPSYMIAIRLMLLFVAVVALIVMQLCWSHLTILKPLFALVSDNTTLFVIGVALGSAVISDRLGYTFLLGAFLAGAAMPFDMSLRSGLAEKVRWMTRWLFLPQYFLYSGFSFDLREIEASDIPFIILFIVLAFAAKALLVPATHYILGFSWREAAFCASLANCRGFNALIIGDTGRTLGQIGEALYVTCTLLSVLSTGAAGPLAKFFKSESGEEDHGRTPARTPRRTPRNLSPRREHELEQSPNDSTIEAEKIELGTDGASDEVDVDGEDDVPMPAHGAAREEMFESFLSERTNAESGMVLVCFPQDVSSRMRDPRNGIKCEPHKAGEEPKFTGIAATDWLCRFYRIERRALGVELAQRLLEAGVLSPITTPIFSDDKKHFYTFGM